MSKCKHKYGLLVLRECGKETDRRCDNCGKPICEEHTTTHFSHQVCYDCKAEPATDDTGADGYAQRAIRRNALYASVGYMPFYSRRYHDDDGLFDDGAYDDIDYDTFDADESSLDFDDFGGDDMSAEDFSDS